MQYSEEKIVVAHEEKKGSQVFIAQLFHIAEDNQCTLQPLNPMRQAVLN
jgi:hypothetical protein